MHSYDMQLVVMSIRTAREVGGNLAEVLQTTMVTMRERVQLRGQVRTLTAEGRISAKVLIALPILMATLPVAVQAGLPAAAVHDRRRHRDARRRFPLLVVGWFWLSRLTKIEV